MRLLVACCDLGEGPQGLGGRTQHHSHAVHAGVLSALSIKEDQRKIKLFCIASSILQTKSVKSQRMQKTQLSFACTPFVRSYKFFEELQ